MQVFPALLCPGGDAAVCFVGDTGTSPLLFSVLLRRIYGETDLISVKE